MKRDVNPTMRQKEAVKHLIEDKSSLKSAMTKAGYSEATTRNPKENLTNKEGFRILCEKAGLTDDLILNALTEDIKAKPKNRKPELELGAKIKGMLVDRTEMTGSINIEMTNYGDNIEDNKVIEKDRDL